MLLGAMMTATTGVVQTWMCAMYALSSFEPIWVWEGLGEQERMILLLIGIYYYLPSRYLLSRDNFSGMKCRGCGTHTETRRAFALPYIKSWIELQKTNGKTYAFLASSDLAYNDFIPIFFGFAFLHQNGLRWWSLS